ncbi:RagB/SusD family nutrient uptake outer membrane protein [Olivibacter sp. SDN3]|uniref:RagB/SusD family nutrient uptake outer membrane protein n=1 Tax=Olivibacter sp. SDN3 TaxID=2764720 RepID=UPI0016512C72|nr:RagB/SusD family nutrient uptake outer membrane protein [Olivibacter sp. SDN3]QNL50840.1 RagB/SusD family nutrient uptake outer membrane protein [Olivibacter sp. SDN3]
MKSIYRKHTRKLLKVSFATLVFTASLSSCSKDFLNLRPELNIPEDNMFDTPERILTHVHGLYASAKDGRLMAGRYFIYNDIRAEEFVNRTTNGVTGLNVYNHTNDAATTQVNNFWIQGYMTINRVNKFLEDFDLYPGVVSPELEANYRAEAKFVRAWMYYALVHMFATPYTQDNGASPGLPLRLQAETNTENNSLPRSTVAEVYQQILTDLNEAEADLPESGSADKTRAYRNTAIALKTRVYLAMGDYPNVIAEANKIVSPAAPFTSPDGSLGLETSVEIAFATPYAGNNRENILSMPMEENNAPGTQNQMGYYYNTGNGNIEYYLNTTTGNLGGIYAHPQWGENDARKTQLTAEASGLQILTKWAGEAPFIDWIPVIRYAEVLLNLAEAEAEAGDQARALALVNAVHTRSDAENPLTSSGNEDLIEKILTERRIELLGEGFRAPDLMRRGQAIPSYGAGGMISPNSSSYVFPIPVGEVQTNPDL